MIENFTAMRVARLVKVGYVYGRALGNEEDKA